MINAVSDARAAGPDHAWQLTLPHYPVIAYADQHRLQQVMANLLANAHAHPARDAGTPKSRSAVLMRLSP